MNYSISGEYKVINGEWWWIFWSNNFHFKNGFQTWWP